MPVSVLLPVYNGLEFLSQSVGSVCAQTCKEWELLIGLNGYPFESDNYKSLKSFESLSPGAIRVLDLGPIDNKSKALNAMVKEAKYDRVAILDVDDIWQVNKLEKQLPYTETYDVVGSDCEYFGEEKGDPKIFLGKLKREFFSLQNPVVNSSVVMKKEFACWDEDNTTGTEDYQLWLELSSKGRTFYNIPEVLVLHRIHSGSSFNAKNKSEEHSKALKSKFFYDITPWVAQQVREILSQKKWEL